MLDELFKGFRGAKSLKNVSGNAWQRLAWIERAHKRGRSGRQEASEKRRTGRRRTIREPQPKQIGTPK
jgi:hypothetical protein